MIRVKTRNAVINIVCGYQLMRNADQSSVTTVDLLFCIFKTQKTPAKRNFMNKSFQSR